MVLLTMAVLAFTDGMPSPPPQPLIPASARARVALVDRLGESQPTRNATIATSAGSRSTAKTAVAIGQAPDTLVRQVLSSAVRDPFRTAQPAVASSAAMPAPPTVPAAPAAAPVVVPAMTYRYLGQLIDPDGKRLVLVTKGDKDVTVSRGSLLDDGFSVADIRKSHITIVHVATSTPFEIRIPESDEAIR
ncbi:hypothetical protein [Roseateles puraquae]|uniref:hypothetical protein n=2 Tax=Roseateles puraquae TaxID=431059 RepID=UPI001302EEEA|nr:hypothetical protein [Roseateles puraquae]